MLLTETAETCSSTTSTTALGLLLDVDGLLLLLAVLHLGLLAVTVSF